MINSITFLRSNSPWCQKGKLSGRRSTWLLFMGYHWPTSGMTLRDLYIQNVSPVDKNTYTQYQLPNRKIGACSFITYTVVLQYGYRVSLLTNRRRKNKKQNWVLWSLILPWTWLGSAWSCLVFKTNSKKRPKNNFQTQGVPVSGDWTWAPWLH